MHIFKLHCVMQNISFLMALRSLLRASQTLKSQETLRASQILKIPYVLHHLVIHYVCLPSEMFVCKIRQNSIWK